MARKARAGEGCGAYGVTPYPSPRPLPAQERAKTAFAANAEELYSAGVAAKAASGIASCGAERSKADAGARLSPKRNTATIK